MHYNFNKRQEEYNLEVKMGDDLVPQFWKFKYLGFIIQNDGEMIDDVTYRIQVGWLKWRKVSGVMWLQSNTKPKGKFYYTARL